MLFVVRNRNQKRLARTLSLHRGLASRNRRIINILINGDPTHHLPSFFDGGVRTPICPFRDPGFLPSTRGGRIGLIGDMTCGIFQLRGCVSDVQCVGQVVGRAKTSIIVGFCRLLAKLACLFYQPGTIVIYVTRRCLFLRPSFAFPGRGHLSLTSLGFFAHVATVKTTGGLTLSFHGVQRIPTSKVIIIPPLLHGRILRVAPAGKSCLRNCLLGDKFNRRVYS